MGKSPAIFLPEFVIAVVSTPIVVLSVSFGTIHPATHNFVLPVPTLLTGFLVNPLLLFGITSLIVLLSLIHNPETGVMPSLLLGFGLMMGIPVGVGVGAIDLASWSFTLYHLAGAIVLWAVVCYLCSGDG